VWNRPVRRGDRALRLTANQKRPTYHRWPDGGCFTTVTFTSIEIELMPVSTLYAGGIYLPLAVVEPRQLGGALGCQAKAPNAVTGRDAAFSFFVVGPLLPGLEEIVPARARRWLTRSARSPPPAGC
jgi:hypothetical protein